MITIGLTLPSSEVIGFFKSGLVRRLAPLALRPGRAHTRRSCVSAEPVRWTSATPGWLTR